MKSVVKWAIAGIGGILFGLGVKELVPDLPPWVLILIGAGLIWLVMR